MALRKCKECGQEISDKAKTCPHCGVASPGKNHIGCGTSALVIIAALVLFSSFGRDKPAANAPPPPPKTAAELRVSEISRCFSGWNGEHTELTKIIMAGLKNPDSYRHVETRYSDKGDRLAVSTTYRATNGFGAVVTETVVAETSMSCNVIKIAVQK